MGAAPRVYTVRLCAREFIDSRVAASFARRSTILSYRVYSLLAYRRRPGVAATGPLRKIQ